MRKWLQRRSWVRAIGAAPLLVWATNAGAADASGVVWDDRHMRSNAARATERSTRPPIQIGEPAPAAAAVVETTLSINPHAWRPGGVAAGSASAAPRAGAARSPSQSAAPTRSSTVRGTGWSQGMRSSSGR